MSKKGNMGKKGVGGFPTKLNDDDGLGEIPNELDGLDGTIETGECGLGGDGGLG
jgi:hypothetical protein